MPGFYLDFHLSPLYDDGKTGDGVEAFFSDESLDHVGPWLAEQARTLIGKHDDDDSECDALDITLTIRGAVPEGVYPPPIFDPRGNSDGLRDDSQEPLRR